MTWLIAIVIALAAGIILPVTTGALFINIAGVLIGFAGMLLDLALKYLIVEFHTQIYLPLATSAGNTIWTASRDIANILIIGMFTFIAISIILNLQFFNAKKTVARVLIIAVLINFSLLFTRLIIDGSNFVAGKFYQVMALDTAVGGAENAVATDAVGVLDFAATAGVSGQFMNLLGLPSAFDTRDTLNEIYDNNSGRRSWGGVMAIMYGLIAAVLMIAVALVLSYATFLLVARTVLLLFLLVTSALAFAAFLVPKWGNKYWDMWWSTLLQNAIFAPLLMFMLWVTMTLSYGLVQGQAAQNRSFDKLLSDPTNSSGILALLIFFIILGMLYASIRFSSSFASKITGFDWASFGPALGLGALARVVGALARVGGFVGQQTLGRGALATQNALMARAKSAEPGSAAQKLYNFGAKGFAGAARRDFNLMQTQLGKEIQKVAKVKNLDELSGKALGGFVGIQERYKKDEKERAQQLAYSDVEKKGIVEKKLEAAMKTNPALKGEYDTAKKAHEDAKTEYEKTRKEALAEQNKIFDRHAAGIEGLRTAHQDQMTRLRATPGDAGLIDEEKKARKALNDALSVQKSEMSHQTERIRQASRAAEISANKFEEINVKLAEIAQENHGLPERFASAGEIAEKSVKNSFTGLLHATTPTSKGIASLAESIGKDAGKTKEDPLETVKLVRRLAREKLEVEKKAA